MLQVLAIGDEGRQITGQQRLLLVKVLGGDCKEAGGQGGDRKSVV